MILDHFHNEITIATFNYDLQLNILRLLIFIQELQFIFILQNI